MKRLRLLLAVSHPLARQLIAEVITKVRGVQLVGNIGSGWEVIPLATQLKPDVIIVDFSLPGLSGIKVADLIRRELPQIRVVILLDDENEEYIKAVEQSGAWGYLGKSQVTEKLPPLLDKLEQNEKRNHRSN